MWREERYTRVTMRTRSPLPVGKLPVELLQGLLRSCRPPARSGVVLGPRYGEDAAVIDLGAKYLVAKTDPITFTAERIGWYAVHINANDIATMGATPRWFLATLLLPENGTTPELARGIFLDILRTCRTLGITLCGGHTEITSGLSRPIVVGQMLGEVRKIGSDSQRQPATGRLGDPHARRSDRRVGHSGSGQGRAASEKGGPQCGEKGQALARGARHQRGW